MPKTYSCIIVEDEPLAMERTMQYASKNDLLDVLHCFDNSIEALNYLQKNEIDLVLLDVRMDEISGIELIESSNTNAQFILTTAYDEYALKGYDLNIADYLLKPFTYARFSQAIDKAISRKKPDEMAYSTGIFIKTENKQVQVLFEDILFIEGMRDYRRFHLKNERIMTLETFTELEKRIPQHLVCRVHKSYMVGIKSIEKIERRRIYIGEHRIPISDSYFEQFSSIIGN